MDEDKKENGKYDKKESGGKKKRQRTKRGYSVISCIAWAFQKLWRIDRNFICFNFARVPVRVAMPLAAAWFSRAIINAVGAGKSFPALCMTAAFFTALLALLEVWDSLLHSRIQGRHYYPTSEVQTDMSCRYNYHDDYENQEKQEYQKVLGYARRDAIGGNCSLEFLWQDISDFCVNSLGIVTYASLLLACHPALIAAVVVTGLLSYAVTRMEPVYYEKHKAQWEKEERKKGYLSSLSENFAAAKDIRLYALEGWLEGMMKDYQAYLFLWKKRCGLRGLWAALLSGAMTLLQDGASYLVLLGILFRGGMNVGDFVFYFGLAGSIAGFLQGFMWGAAKLVQRADKIAYYRDFYNYPNRCNHGKGCPLPTEPVRIELKDVWYRYDGAKEDTLKGINLIIEAGGEPGAGGIKRRGKEYSGEASLRTVLPYEGRNPGGRKTDRRI